MEKIPTALKILVLLGIGHVFCEDVSVKAGADHTFIPQVKGQIEGILWKFQNNKLVEYEGGETWYRFRDRGRLNKETGVLTLQKLYKNESGLYEAEIQVDGKIQQSKYYVTVIDPVPVPKVTCNVTDNKITLQCSVDPPDEVHFEWSGPKGFTDSRPTVQVEDTNPESLYYCTAKNEVSRESRQFALRECYTGGGLRVVFIVVIVAIVAIIILIIAGALFVVYKKMNNGRELVPASKP